MLWRQTDWWCIATFIIIKSSNAPIPKAAGKYICALFLATTSRLVTAATKFEFFKLLTSVD